MPVYVVTWNLNRERKNYNQARDAFIKQLQRYEHARDPGLETSYFISTNSTPEAVRNFLKLKLDDNDRLFVSRVRSGEYNGWLIPEVWNWLIVRC